MKLREYVSKRAKEKGFWKALMEVYEEVEKKRSIKLVDPNPPKSFVQYLLTPAYSLWLWTALSLAISTLVVIWLNEFVPLLTPLRYVLGTLFVLYLPGYALIEALYPEQESLKPLERLALSIGLSLAIVPLIGLVLNYTPWGIRLDPVVISLSLFITSMLLLASYRKYRIVSILTKDSRQAR